MTGTVYTETVVHLAPEAFAKDVPYQVVIVSLEDGSRVTGRMLGEGVAEYISRTRQIRVGPEHVSIVPGGKPIIFFPILALIEPGDEVIYPNPGFPIYESMIRFSGARPVPIPLREDRGFSFDLGVLEKSISPKTKMLILNSPQNPTGGIIPPEDIRAIADLVRDRDLLVLSDEIYSRIYYGEPPASIASLPGMLEKTIILDGMIPPVGFC